MAVYCPTPGFKGRTFKFCVLIRWDFNFCVRSSPLQRTKIKSRNFPHCFCVLLTSIQSGRLHPNTHTPFTQQSRSRLTMPLPRHSVGTYQVTSSHATRQGTLSHSRLSSLRHCGLALKVELVCAKWSNLLSQIRATEEEKPPPPSPVWTFFFFFFF